MNQLDLNTLGALQSAGQNETAYQQSLIDADMAKYNYNTTAQPNWDLYLAQIPPGHVSRGADQREQQQQRHQLRHRYTGQQPDLFGDQHRYGSRRPRTLCGRVVHVMMSPLDRHGRGALQFSGGKDSLALVHLLRPQWDRLTLYHVDTGDLLPEVREIVDRVEAMVPSFVRIPTDSSAWMARFGMPSDLVPTSSSPVGLAIGASRLPIVDRFLCCGANIMVPMHQRMVADGITLAIRGTKRCDTARLPAESGDTSSGYELWLPLQEWSHDDVFRYLREVGAPICRVYDNHVNAPECATCPAWWSEGRAGYLKQHHPALYDAYRAKLAAVSTEVSPHWQALEKEMT